MSDAAIQRGVLDREMPDAVPAKLLFTDERQPRCAVRLSSAACWIARCPMQSWQSFYLWMSGDLNAGCGLTNRIRGGHILQAQATGRERTVPARVLNLLNAGSFGQRA